MGLFGSDKTGTLEDVLGNQANAQAGAYQDAATQKRKRLVSQQAHDGRLMSGVSNYNLADADAAEGSGISDIYSNLAGALGQVPAEDYLNQNGLQNNYSLAQLIGSLNKPSSLQEALGMLGQAGNIGAKFAAFA